MKAKSFLYSKLLSFLFSKTAKNTYFVLTGNSLALICAFFYTVTLVRILTLSDFGYFSALFSLLLVVTDIADVGIGTSLSRFLPTLKHNQDRMLSFLKSSFLVQLLIAIFAVCMMFIFSPFISTILFHDSQKAELVKIISLGLFGLITANFFLYAVSAKEKFVQAALISTIIGMFRMLFVIPLIIFSIVSLKSIIWVLSISLILAAIFSFFLVGTRFLKAERVVGDVKKLLHFSSFVGSARILTTVSSRLDVLMLIALTNSVQTGLYSTAARVASLYTLFTGSFLTVIGPRIATISDYENLKKFLLKVIIGTLGLIATILILILIAKPFMLILFSEKAAASVPVFQMLLVSMIFFVGSIPAVAIAVYFLKKPYILTINSILQLFVVVLGNLILIPLFGNIGPTISLILAYGLSFILTSYMSYYHLRQYVNSSNFKTKMTTKGKFDTISGPELV